MPLTSPRDVSTRITCACDHDSFNWPLHYVHMVTECRLVRCYSCLEWLVDEADEVSHECPGPTLAEDEAQRQVDKLLRDIARIRAIVGVDRDGAG